ncbi:MAG TPA: DUF4340 domain-containing protein, partial [Thiotrichaceae bacterium]|nr:DUF4340 domain-containing protein [Thiotrichaceae bacterium]
MRQRWILNLVLLGFILVLGALAFYTQEQEKAELPKLTDLKAEQVQNIRIERANKEGIELKKDAQNAWQMTTPFQLPANHYRLERLMDILSHQDYTALTSTELNLSELKLKPPLASVNFNPLKVAWGDTSPINTAQRYIQINDKKVYVLTDTHYQQLTGDATSFINLSLLGEEAKIQALKMPNYDLVLKEEQWTVNTPFSADEIDTSQDAINTLMSNWQQAQAYHVERYIEGPIEGEIQITLKAQKQPLHFAIISLSPALVLARPDK